MPDTANKIRDTATMLRSYTRSRGWLQLPENEAKDPIVKPAPYLPIYERLLAPLRRRAFTMLELGVWSGQSLQMWRDAFPLATIIGVDLAPPDLHLGHRVHIIRGDQTDDALMRDIRAQHAPRGFDVIIDDASHFGITTARSLQVLYTQHLRPDGFYCIEDWGTGYMPNWHDGGRIAAPVDIAHLDSAATPMGTEAATPIPMPSHDLGMVGLIKRLVDHVASGTARVAQPDAIGEVLAIESMTVQDGIVVLHKPST